MENENKYESELESHKLLLDLMRSRYEEEERRNNLIDTKNSRMISINGVMLSLHINCIHPINIVVIKPNI